MNRQGGEDAGGQPDRRGRLLVVVLGGEAAPDRLLDLVAGVRGGAEIVWVVAGPLGPPADRDALVARLVHVCRVPLTLTGGACPLRADEVYLVDGYGASFAGTNGWELVAAADQDPSLLLRSLAVAAGERAVVASLAGSSPGTLPGVLDVAGAGGLVVSATEPGGAAWGGGRSPLESEATWPSASIPEALAAFLDNPARRQLEAAAAGLLSDDRLHLARLFERIRAVYDLDFELYKPGTILRRIERRLGLSQALALSDYVTRALEDPGELHALSRDLLVGVTRFFRDRDTFELLRREVIPGVLDATPAGSEVRVWVPGCSTGEEAYSIAMLFLEALEAKGRGDSLKLFATYVNRDSLQVAAEGSYAVDALVDVPKHLLDRYFREDGKTTRRVGAQLRACIVFSPHNLLRDPPFTKLDLVSCRNLLIYLRPAAQAKVMGALYFALRHRGVLLLGPSEAPSELAEDLELIHRDQHLYRKATDRRVHTEARTLGSLVDVRPPRATPAVDPRLGRAYDQLLQRFVPTGALVNERKEVLHLFGDAHRILQPHGGRLTLDVTHLAEGDVRYSLARALTQSSLERGPVCVRSVASRGADGRHVLYDLTVAPLEDRTAGPPLYLVTFELVGAGAIPADVVQARVVEVEADVRERVLSLESELHLTRESLQQAMEQLEVANEELQASNEEMLASNEELQSANEELQSVNEEVCAANEAHEARIVELHRVTDNLRNLMAATEVGSIFTDREGRVRLFTPVAAQIFHLLPHDLGRDLRHFTTRIPGDDVFEELARVSAGGTSPDARVATADGRVWLRRIAPYSDLEDRAGGIILTFVDVTELSRAEQQIRELNTALELRVLERTQELAASEERMRLVAEQGTDGYWDWYLGSEEIHLSESFRALFGYSEAELPNTRSAIAVLLHPDDLPRASAEYEAHLASGGTYEVVVRYRHRDGRWIWVRSRGAVLRNAAGKAYRMVGTHTDISAFKDSEQALLDLTEDLERKVTERTAALASSEEQFRKMVESAPEGVLMVDADGVIVLANPRVAQIFDHPVDGLRGMSVDDLVPEAMRGGHRRLREGYGELPEARPMGAGRELHGRRRDGSLVAIEVGLSPIVLQGMRFVVAFVSDITERKRAEAGIRGSEANFRATFERAGIGKALFALSGRIERANATLCAMLGYTEAELCTMDFQTLTHPDDMEASRRLHRQLVAGETPAIRFEKRFLRRDGSVVWAGLTAVVLHGPDGTASQTFAEFEERTALKAAQQRQRDIERKLLEAAKLESLGVLAGGVAHDFNNILTGLLMHAELLEGALSDDPTLAAWVGSVLTSGRRAADICQQMLAYSGQATFQLVDTDISWLVRDTERLIHLSLAKSVRVQLDLEEGLPVVHADPAQLQQVVMNLVINASAAMGPRGGTIQVRTRRSGPPEGFSDASPWVRLEVEDDGAGIAPDLLAKIFDPFFTTKFQGRGLGLAAVRGIIAGHEGRLDVTSAVGVGTTFTALLPGRQRDEGRPAASAPAVGPMPAARVLVIDDEVGVRAGVRHVLTQAGCAVTAAEDGAEGLDVYEADPARFDVVLLDLTMPGLDGSQVLAGLQRVRPDVRVVLMSGYTEPHVTGAHALRGLAGFLKKPFTRAALLEAVREAVTGE